MVLLSIPVSMVSFRSLSVLGTFSASRTVAVRMSMAPKSSKVTSGFCGSTLAAASFASAAFAAASLAALVAFSLATWASTTLSSTLAKRSTASPSSCPTGRRSAFPRSSQQNTGPSTGSGTVVAGTAVGLRPYSAAAERGWTRPGPTGCPASTVCRARLSPGLKKLTVGSPSPARWSKPALSPTFRIPRSFSAENGVKGSNAMARLAQI